MLGQIKKIEEEEDKNERVSEENKRGRKIKSQRSEYIVNRSQTKFVVDLSGDSSALDLVFKLLCDANKKDYGHEITFKEMSIYALERLGPKDLEKIQEGSLSEMEKVERALKEFNAKNGLSLSLGEFLVKKLNIN
ncbi:MAG: hypothetical protein A2451_11740 [Bdellovibrionales bacterium RIFOXYC2_FULL_39_8]|nr:MAG: hypothetical protein A2385_14740 [Bdellovibrionales bacterium RIFOXYB1_FULL_39_21]OFZ43768.1 MAG: hypothetical protein A2485_04190 [Bdellovibrionales bacterium RIFOXYC12_FULL_39_17]OFZ47674.1 MAG: hypothetical protein A2404_09705 [Bdellovibrionales bacterium RIFOXYC1_FULL_39_130]OFZ69401.1 MAG: hypothetical protein A2451_11740 [Bdellovibrionales bacterium RIFOXYC2_FULL_39_8]OFZ76440.1 MAG: hypothetical protein A2560_17715 [Bdellovibrionales bacterium RIFOXYD1_FULL_39_84]